MASQPGATLDADGARQLLRRATFEASPKAVESFTGITREQAANRLVNYKPSHFRPNHRYDIQLAHNKWIKYMLRTTLQLQEKMVLFLHDHFATGNVKVQYPALMSLQNRTLRIFSNGNFKDLVKTMIRDPALMEYLDTPRNYKAVPNENFARELQELFTLGVFDLNGKANYKQADIVQIARAFTGWYWDYGKTKAFLNDGPGGEHDTMADFPERGPKVIYGSERADDTGNVGGFAAPQPFAPPEGEDEIDAVIDIIFQHKDTDDESTVARFLTKKLISYFCYDDPSKALIDQVIAYSKFATDGDPDQWNLGALVKAIIINDAFYETATPAPYSDTTKKSVKWPVDYVIGTLRLLNMTVRSKYAYLPGGVGDTWDQLTAMGQTLFDPPSVFGWNWESSWISTSTLLARYSFARDVIHDRYGGGRTVFHSDKLVDIELTDPLAIVNRVLDLLAVRDQFTTTERDALIDYLTDGNPMGTVDLQDYNTRNAKLNGLFAIVLQSPQYQVH